MKKGLNIRQKSLLLMLLFALLLLLMMPLSAYADIGPKPSVRVEFKNTENRLCYGTLLSAEPSTGPHSVWDKSEGSMMSDELDDFEIWQAFANYEDKDGFYYLQIYWEITDKKGIDWTYYPPNTFKVLLYFPETESFAVSGICTRQAFDTYYTVDMKGAQMGEPVYNGEKSGNSRLDEYLSHNRRMELHSLGVRITATVAVELLIALLFGIRKGKQLLVILAANAMTQLALNLALRYFMYADYLLLLIIAELLVFLVEAVIYCLCLNRLTDRPRKRRIYIFYALAANTASIIAGLWLAELFPARYF